MILFLKAAIRGGASADLFATPVQVDGYTTKDGTFVAPHASTRLKRHDAPAQPDLFSVEHPSAAPEAVAPEPPKAEAVKDEAPDELALPAVEPEAAPEKADVIADEEGARDAPADPAVEASITQWGMPAGTSKVARRQANAAALELLASKADDDMGAADKAVLARYTGRGGIGDSLNEFYTEPAVASAMWSMLAALGFKGGEVLEPSSGTGVYLHTAPAGVRVTAVELDPTSARIAGIIHRAAGHEVNNASLERFATQDGRQFDAVIGNVPFGLRGGLIKDDKRDLATADQYFVDTALDKAKDGGLVALIVPTGIVDSKTGRSFRERLLRKGEFLGAHRLPNTAFEASHTGVTSDIILLRKRPQDVAGALSTLSQDQIKGLGVWDDDFLSGSYFTDGRGSGNVMGRLEEGWRAKAGMGHDITVTGSMSGVPEALAAWHPDDAALRPASLTVPDILDSLGNDLSARQRAITAALKPPYQVAKVGDVRVINGVRYILQGEPPRWHRAEDEAPAAIEDARSIAEMLDDLAEGRAKDPRYTRGALIEALDDYVRLHGIPARNREMLRWLAAPSLPTIEGEEPGDHARRVDETRRRAARLLGAVSDTGEYSDLVTGWKREGEAADIDTVATKLSLEAGGFTVDQLAATAGGTAESVLDHIYASPAYALEPDGRTWVTMDVYLGGELWPKYDAAVAMAKHEGITPEAKAKYAAQAAALEEAIQPQSIEDVEVLLSSGFITPDVIAAWLNDENSEASRGSLRSAGATVRRHWSRSPSMADSTPSTRPRAKRKTTSPTRST